jgi:ATP phosphoribosyltransferase
MSIVVAIPSKGRMKDDAVAAFARAGLDIVSPENNRAYRTKVKGRKDIEIALLSASEIARELAAGAIDLGVTGEDLVRESATDWGKRMEIVARLGFGKADVVVAVPDHWHDVETMADLDDVAADFRHKHGRRLRIATKYWRMTQNFFSQKHGIQVYQIVESLGATEGAPAAGLSDLIVDITSTGSTLTANHLKMLGDGVILKSEACLVQSMRERMAQDAAALAAIATAIQKSK